MEEKQAREEDNGELNEIVKNDAYLKKLYHQNEFNLINLDSTETDSSPNIL